MKTNISEADSAKTSTGQSRWAYCLAAIILLANIPLGSLWSTFDAFVVGGPSSIILNVIDFALAVGLLQFRHSIRQWVLVRALLGAILWPIASYFSGAAITTLVITIMQWSFCGALVLLLTGRSKTWRTVLGLGLYVTGNLVLLGLLIFAIMMVD